MAINLLKYTPNCAPHEISGAHFSQYLNMYWASMLKIKIGSPCYNTAFLVIYQCVEFKGWLGKIASVICMKNHSWKITRYIENPSTEWMNLIWLPDSFLGIRCKGSSSAWPEMEMTITFLANGKYGFHYESGIQRLTKIRISASTILRMKSVNFGNDDEIFPGTVSHGVEGSSYVPLSLMCIGISLGVQPRGIPMQITPMGYNLYLSWA